MNEGFQMNSQTLRFKTHEKPKFHKLNVVYQNMYNKTKYYFEATSYINDSIICRQTIFNQLNIMVPYVDIICLCNNITIL